jgi:CheY-like chemotaxis protein
VDIQLETYAPLKDDPGLPPTGFSPAPKPKIVLLVDDVESVRELMATVLEAAGFTVLRARHSKEALFFSDEFPGTIDLLLTDFAMGPYQNGYELAQRIRATRPGIKVMYTSGYVDYNILREEIESSLATFLAKPFSPAGLLECVYKTMGIPA